MAEIIHIFGKTDPEEYPEPPPLPETKSYSNYRLMCSYCSGVDDEPSREFRVILHTEDPNDIKALICCNCGGRFVPAVITADMFQDTLEKRDAMAARKLTRYKWLWRIVYTYSFIRLVMFLWSL
ncbi:MAG: hypothetical protein ACYTBJ_00590 [Planctomycetota bacterium]|jgi:hypothetical protein